MFFRRLLTALIAFSLICTPLLGTQAAFRDVQQSDPYYPAVNLYSLRGVLTDNGGLFRPNSCITRAAFIKVLIGKIPADEKFPYIKLPYRDTLEAEWYTPYLKAALKRGILTGETANFTPAGCISQLEGLRYVYRSFPAVRLPATAVKVYQYADISKRIRPEDALILEKALQDELITPISTQKLGAYESLLRGNGVMLIYNATIAYQDSQALNGGELDNTLFEGVDPQLKQVLLEVYAQIRENYLLGDTVTNEQLVNGAIAGIVEALGDPYSEYVTRAEAEAFTSDRQGKYVGIGVQVDRRGGDLVIIAPYAGSPAEKAGILPGDIISKVDGTSVEDMEIADVSKLIRGEPGTSVVVEIERRGETEPRIFTIVRAEIKLAPVEYRDLGNGMAYFKINQFLPDLVTEFSRLYTENLPQDPRGIVLDFRNNPGGLLGVAIDFASIFLEHNQIILYIRDRNGNEAPFGTPVDGRLSNRAKISVVALFNNGSASASELLAGALKDNGRAILVGEKTYGKGIGQSTFDLSDGSLLKITTFYFFPPSKTEIHKIGIAPDILVKNDPQNPTQDLQLEKAIEVLRAEIAKQP